MKTLRQGMTGEQVKIMQAIINDGTITVDGLFGGGTKRRLAAWQKAKGLVGDGVCGPTTWKYMGFYPSKFANLYVMKIPFTKITKSNVLLKDKISTYTVDKFGREYGCNVVINAAMFDMRTRQNVTDLIIDGKLNNGGNFSSKGIVLAPSPNFRESTTAECIGKPMTDFIGGAPTLVSNKVRSVDMKGLGQSFFLSITQRMTIGFDANNLIIITTGQTNKSGLENIIQEYLYQGAIAAIDLDGGGSTAMYIRNKTVFTAGRTIPSVIGLNTTLF